MNIYSIKEIVEATNNILNPKEENKISNKSNISRTIEKKEIFKKPLILIWVTLFGFRIEYLTPG